MQSVGLKLSIIVPVYNAEKWLRRCVESLLNQGINSSEYEILLIDDGSKDGSLAIANEFAASYGNTRVFTQPNAGPGAARNRGIDNAKGRYLMFVDADDYLKPNSLASILDLAISNRLDLCFYRLLVLTQEGNHIGGCEVITHNICTGGYAMTHGADIGSACICLLSSKLLQENSICFTSINQGEDTLFMTGAMAFASRVKFLPQEIYVYDLTRDTSNSRLVEIHKDKLMDSLFIAHQTHGLASQGLMPSLSNFLHKRANSMIVSQMIDVLMHKKLYGASFVSKYFNRLYDLRLYPISGQTLSWRTTMLIPILNIIKPFLPK